MERLLTVTTAACAALALAACAGQAGTTAPADEADYRVSVEIPLNELHVAEGEILRVNELLDERTDFDAKDFLLDEVVVVARSNGDVEASAEVLLVEWRSGQVAIPAGEDDDWYEVRVPAPGEDLGGAWLLDITGDATVDMVVAVLQPQPRRVAEARTVYRTTTVYQSSPVREVFWIYDPARYYVVHYHGAWPYRYFIGPWSYRYYDLAYRPHRYHYGPIYRAWHWRDAHPRRYGHTAERRHSDRPVEQARRSQAAPRRIAPALVQLRRAHPRLRTLPRSDRARRPAPGRRGETNLADDARPATASRQIERRAVQRGGTTTGAERSTSGSRTLRQRGVPPRATATAQRGAVRSPQRRQAPARNAAGQRTSASGSAEPRARTVAPTAPRARRFERAPSRSSLRAAREAAPRRSVAAPNTRAGVRSAPRPAVRRATGPQPSRNVQTRRAAPQRSAAEARRTVRPTRSIQPQRGTRPAPAVQPRRPAGQRAVQPRRPAARTPAPVRRADAPAPRGRQQSSSSQSRQPAARAEPTRQPARTARQARTADARPAAGDGRGRRFERR